MGGVSWDWPAFPPRLAKFIETGEVFYSYGVVGYDEAMREASADYEAKYDYADRWAITYILAFFLFILIVIPLFVWSPW